MSWISIDKEKPKNDQLCVTSYKPVKGRVSTLSREYRVGVGLSTLGYREADLWMPLPQIKDE